MFHGMDYVCEVWRLKSFSEAAKKLYISQPALSNSIKRVEDKLGTPIFDRSTNPITLTEVGEAYIHTAEQIMALEENFSNFLGDRQQLKKGKITIGSGATLSSYLLPKAIANFKKQYPYVDFRLVEGDSVHLQEWLQEGILDLVLENNPFPEAQFGAKQIRREHLLLVVPRSWPVNDELLPWQQSIENVKNGRYLRPQYPHVDLVHFRDYPFVLLSAQEPGREIAMQLFRDSGFEPNCVLTVGQQLTGYNLACQGMGGAFVSDTLIREAPQNQEVIFYKLPAEVVARDICFYYKKNRYLPLSVKEFLERNGDGGTIL